MSRRGGGLRLERLRLHTFEEFEESPIWLTGVRTVGFRFESGLTCISDGV